MTIAPVPTIPIPPNPSPTGYLSFPITLDVNQLLATALTNIQAKLPGWVPMEGHLEVMILEETAQMVQVAAAVASQVPMSIFMAFGQLAGIPPKPGIAATCEAMFTMIDQQSYQIAQGTQISFPISGNQTILFTVQQTTVIPASTTSAPSQGTVPLICSTVGSFPNGLPSGTNLQMNQTIQGVESVVSTTAVSGGVDPDNSMSYMARLSDELALMAPRPILPEDFADMASNVNGVFRATAINGLNPGRTVTDGVAASGSVVITSATANFTSMDVGRSIDDPGTVIPTGATIATVNSPSSINLSAGYTATANATGLHLIIGDLTGQERCVTVCGVTQLGQPLTAVDPLTGQTLDQELLAYLQAKREVNFLVYLIDPTYTEVDVTVTVLASPNQNLTALQAAVVTAIQNFLSPALWGGGIFQPPEWTNTPTVSLLGCAQAILAVTGVSFIAVGGLEMCLHGGSLASTDVILPGDAPLPQPGTINVTITT